MILKRLNTFFQNVVFNHVSHWMRRWINVWGDSTTSWKKIQYYNSIEWIAVIFKIILQNRMRHMTSKCKVECRQFNIWFVLFLKWISISWHNNILPKCNTFSRPIPFWHLAWISRMILQHKMHRWYYSNS